MSVVKTEKLKTVVIGSGLASLNFIDAYLEKKKHIDVISPNFSVDLCKNKEIYKSLIKFLPTQMNKAHQKTENYYFSNKINVKRNCKVLGSLEFGGLSNYWGLQIDGDIDNDISYLKKNTIREIKESFYDFLANNKLLGKYYLKKNKIYNNDYKIPKDLNLLNNQKKGELRCYKPILAFTKKKNRINEFKEINEKKDKLLSQNFFKTIKNRKKIRFHNYFVEKIYKERKKTIILCRNTTGRKKFIVERIIMGAGTIATTKIVMDYLNMKEEVKIKHHPRLISVFLSRNPNNSPLNFTPSLLLIKNTVKKDEFSGDIRPGNKLITNSIMELSWIFRPFKFLINILKDHLIFSNILLDSSFSNLFIKKDKNSFKIYSKNSPTLKELIKRQKKIFKFLLKEKKIFPIYKNFFPGIGADYHYFGTVPMNKKKKKMSVNENCLLSNSRNIYIVDGSVINFKSNKYPLGLVIANARRIGKKLSK